MDFDGNASSASSSSADIHAVPQLMDAKPDISKIVTGKEEMMAHSSPVSEVTNSPSSSQEEFAMGADFPMSVVDMLLAEAPTDIPVIQEPWSDLLDDYFRVAAS